MTLRPEIIVLCGGLSSEREVSLRSGQAMEARFDATKALLFDKSGARIYGS